MTSIKPGATRVNDLPPSESSLYPLLSESERPSATTDFIDGCLSYEHHKMITDIREVSPRKYPTSLSVIRAGIENLQKEIWGA
jgi:hypothetical protein